MTAGIALTAQAARATALYFDITTPEWVASWYQAVPPVYTPQINDITVSVTDGFDIYNGVTSTISEVSYFNSNGAISFFDSSFINTYIVVGAPRYDEVNSVPVFSPTGGTISLGGNDGDSLSITAVPEPATWTMMIVGIGGLGAALRATRRFRLAALTA